MNKIIENFLEREVKSKFRDQLNPNHRIEIQVNGNCDLKCSYCYCNKFPQLFPQVKKSKILNNLDILLNWFEENSFNPIIDLFSGELFSQSVGREVLEKIVNWHIKTKQQGQIIIPTNGNFLDSPEITEWVKKIIAKASNNGIKIILSISIDGKYAEQFRPKRNNKPRLDDFYHKVFSFASSYKFGIHPMIYSEAIDYWIENFDWFMDMLQKYNIPYSLLYLLEVRNYNWTVDQSKQMYKLMRHITSKICNIIKENNLDIKEIFKQNRMFNILSVFGTIGRGIGCSIQSTTQVRLGDLSVHPCHRTNYPELKAFEFKVKDNKITGITVDNPDMYLAIQSTDVTSLPFCQFCLFKFLCIGGCLGSQYEVNGDPFIPIPTVCRMEHQKISGIIDEFYDQGLLTKMYEILPKNKKNSIELYLKHFRRNL